MLALIRLSGNSLKLLWLLRLCCLKPIAHRCMVVNCGHRRFSIHLISWKLHIIMGVNCYLKNLDGAVHLRCLYITMFPRLMLLFVNWFMPYGVVVTIVLMFWLINCSHQTFILSLNYLNVGASYCTNVLFCCFLIFFFFYTIIFSLLLFHGLCMLLK